MSVRAAQQPRQQPGGWLRKNWIQIVVNILALLPLVLLLIDFFGNNLSVDPIRDITFRTGTFALVTLVLSLACTPLNTLFGWRWTLPLRRTLGLYAFFYTLLHFLTFVVLDYGLNAAQLQEAILEKRYALVGFVAFLILLALAITSTRGWMRRLGKNWKRLHNLVYLAVILALVHFFWLVKPGDWGEPLIFTAVVALLFVVRLPSVKKRISNWRYRRRQAQSSTQ